jgi:EAL domain-containing protein (putative c-di-GMP-specific phosphodiesterase class I)
LRQAIADGGFEVHYQPCPGRTTTAPGCEALLRWRHRARHDLARRIRALAEDTGLINQLGGGF